MGSIKRLLLTTYILNERGEAIISADTTEEVAEIRALLDVSEKVGLETATLAANKRERAAAARERWMAKAKARREARDKSAA